MIPVLHFIGSLRIGGAERQFVTLLRAFDRETFHHEIAVFRESGPLVSEVEELGFPIHWLNFRHRDLLGFHRRASDLLCSREILIMHAHLHLTAVHGRLAGRRAGTPALLYTEHSDVSRRSSFWRMVECKLAGMTSAKIAVSEAQRQASIEKEGFPAEKIHTIANSIPLADFGKSPQGRSRMRAEWGVGEEEVVIGNVSNLTDQKRLDRLIRASAALHRNGVAHRLVLVGDGPQRGDLERLAEEALPAGSYQFLGRRSDVPRVLECLDLFAISSRWEGMPINLLEAMGTGLAIVATAVGGIPDVLEDGHDALLVAEGDQDALVEALRRSLESADLRGALGANARRTVERSHDSTRNARRIERLYFECLEKADVDCRLEESLWEARWREPSGVMQ